MKILPIASLPVPNMIKLTLCTHTPEYQLDMCICSRFRRNLSTPMSTFSQSIYFFSAFSTVNCHLDHTLQLQSCGQQQLVVPAGTNCQILRTGRRFLTRRDHIFFSRFINCSIDLTFFPKFLLILLHYPVRLKSNRYSTTQSYHQEDNLVHHSPHITWPCYFVRLTINKDNQDLATLPIDQRY